MGIKYYMGWVGQHKQSLLPGGQQKALAQKGIGARANAL